MRFWNRFLILPGMLLALPLVSPPHALAQQATTPPLVITNAPLPPEIRDKVYAKPVKTKEIQPSEVMGRDYFEPTQTIVSQAIDELGAGLYAIQSQLSGLSANLNGLQRENAQKAAEYYAAVATINTQLQTGTTPGNPRLLNKIGHAESSLENLGASVMAMNDLATEATRAASEAAFFLDSTRAAYGISGAVEEDHVRLAELEDATNSTILVIERILNNVNDDITRTNAYLSSERNNLRTLSLAVANGDLYGKSLSNHPFSRAGRFDGSAVVEPVSYSTREPITSPAPSSPRPLVKIRFDQPDVEYEQPVYMAVNEALERYPNARFNLVAVHPTTGNAAEVAIESTKARRNAERVLRTLNQMGLPLERVDLSYDESVSATSSEVHLYIQ